MIPRIKTLFLLKYMTLYINIGETNFESPSSRFAEEQTTNGWLKHANIK